MTAFKVGDRVRLTVDKSPWGSLGEEGNILRFDVGLAEVSYDKSGDWWVNPRHLELVADAAPQQPFPVGSYVRHLTSQDSGYFKRGDVARVEGYNRFDGWLEFRDREGDILSRQASAFEAADEPRIEAAPPAAPPRRIDIGDTFKALCDGCDYDEGDTFVVTGIDGDDDLNFTDNNGDENFIDRRDAEFVSSPRPFKAGDWVNTPDGHGIVVLDDGDEDEDRPYHIAPSDHVSCYRASELTPAEPYSVEPASADPDPANDNIRPGDIVQVTDSSSFNSVVRVGDLATVDRWDGEVYHLRFPRTLSTPLEQISYGDDIAPYPASIAA